MLQLQKLLFKIKPLILSQITQTISDKQDMQPLPQGKQLFELVSR
jgi:hypothetical protein